MSLSPTSLSFGAQLMGSSSLKTVTLTNLGSTPLSISSLSVVSFAPLILPRARRLETSRFNQARVWRAVA